MPPPSPDDLYVEGPGEEISFLEMLNTVLRNRRLVLAVPFFLFVVVVGYVLLQPRTFTSTASFIPQDSSSSSRASALAAQLGISLPTSESGQSLQFYADLIRSREVLQQLVDTTYTFQDGTSPVTASLAELFKVEGNDAARVRERAIRELRDRISVSTNRETGLVSFTVQSEWRELSRVLATTVLDRLNRFNLQTRQSQAGTERGFVERRMAVARDSLLFAENALQSFLQKNKQYESSPELSFVFDRLQREVARRQQIFNSLSSAYEQARIDEVRDTPVFTLVETPESPVLPDRRRLLLKGALALMVGFMLGIFAALMREWVIQGRIDSDDLREFEQLRRETLRDLTHPWRLIR